MVNTASDKVIKLKEQIKPHLFAEFSDRYKSEPRGLFACKEGIVLVPETTFDVAEILVQCNILQMPVIPFGGGTGLVGGQIYTGSEYPAVVSLHQMNRIREVSPLDQTVTVEAGCILQDIHEEVEQYDHIFPLSIASKGSCQIGGNLATNAGGVHVMRYGNTRDLCLGVEVVLPDGTIMNNLNKLHKDNLGLDLKNLLIGSEGTLGIITAATMKIFPKPMEETTALLSVSDLETALELLIFFKKHFGNLISAFELISATGFEFVKETGLVTRLPFKAIPRWAVLVDLGSEFYMDLNERLGEVSGLAVERGLILDGVIAHSEQQRMEFWAIRELIPEANRLVGAIVSNDISLPISKLPTFVARAESALDQIGHFRTNCFGHIGDGNLHFNVFALRYSDLSITKELRDHIRETILNIVNDLEGSTSAEHGTGRLKVEEIPKYRSQAFVGTIEKIKQTLDPNNIMNPGVLIPPQD